MPIYRARARTRLGSDNLQKGLSLKLNPITRVALATTAVVTALAVAIPAGASPNHPATRSTSAVKGGVGVVVVDPVHHISAVLSGGGAISHSISGHGSTAKSAPARKTCLDAADLNAGRGLRVTAVDWVHGTATIYKALPVCSGTPLQFSGAQYVYGVGSHPEGGAHPNVPLWPQKRQATSAWQSATRTAGYQKVAIPPVPNQCSQNDVGLRTTGSTQVWPPVLNHPGEAQPKGLAFYDGNNRGCVVSPAVRVQSKCPASCRGTSTGVFTLSARSPYATTHFHLTKLGDPAPFKNLDVAGVKTVTFRAGFADGTRVRVTYEIEYLGKTSTSQVGKDVEFDCPPAPHLVFDLDCVCGQLISAHMQDLNVTRYDHQITITNDGHSFVVDAPSGSVRVTVYRFTVESHQDAVSPLGLHWAGDTELHVVVQSYRNGHAVGQPWTPPMIHID